MRLTTRAWKNRLVALPVSTWLRCVINRRSRRMKASGPDAPTLMSRDTCPKQSSIRVVMSAVEGLSGVMHV